MKLIFLKGLPASGKTTWANAYKKDHPDTVIVTKDDIRAEHPDWKENAVLKERNSIIIDTLNSRMDAVSADCNLNPFHEKTLRSIAMAHEAEFEIVSFLDVSLEECIKRDALREVKSVGEKVVRDMYDKWLKPSEWNDDLPTCILCDVDGSLAEKGDRGPYDYSKVMDDKPIKPVVEILNRFSHGCEMDDKYTIIIFSGRDDDSLDITSKWMKTNGIPFDNIFMRKTGDKRSDYIVKRELYNEYIRGQYNVLFVIDDRPQVTKLWRELGIFCLDVYQDIDRKEF